MFTGIVEETGKVVSVRSDKLVISADVVLEDLKFGDSIAVNGVCLTATAVTADSFSVDVMPETSERSSIQRLKPGDRVNLERAMTLGGRMGGHLVQGHIDATGTVISMQWQANAMLVRIEAPESVMHYITEKCFIAVDGISLTVVDRDELSFRVSVVKTTRESTVLSSRKNGDMVNLEVDIIAKYVEQFTQARSKGITTEFLQENGFMVG